MISGTIFNVLKVSFLCSYLLAIDRIVDENKLRLRMSIKLISKGKKIFNLREVIRIRGRFTSWTFPRNDFFGPYELLDFPLEGPYGTVFTPNLNQKKKMTLLFQ